MPEDDTIKNMFGKFGCTNMFAVVGKLEFKIGY